LSFCCCNNLIQLSASENGLALTTAKIYAITQSTSVSVKSEQISETPTSTSTLPVLAGMDSLLASLNELIAEPISKAGHYRKYGKLPVSLRELRESDAWCYG